MASHKKTVKSRVHCPTSKNAVDLNRDSMPIHSTARDSFRLRNMLCVYLQFSLGGLKSRCEQLAHIVSCLVEVVAHAVAAQTLRNDIEVETIAMLVEFIFHWTFGAQYIPVLVDHVGNTETSIDDLAPAITVEEL